MASTNQPLEIMTAIGGDSPTPRYSAMMIDTVLGGHVSPLPVKLSPWIPQEMVHGLLLHGEDAVGFTHLWPGHGYDHLATVHLMQHRPMGFESDDAYTDGSCVSAELSAALSNHSEWNGHDLAALENELSRPRYGLPPLSQLQGDSPVSSSSPSPPASLVDGVPVSSKSSPGAWMGSLPSSTASLSTTSRVSRVAKVKAKAAVQAVEDSTDALAESSSEDGGTDDGVSDSTGLNPRLHCPHPGCHRAYRKPAQFKVHVRRHNGAKPFVCDWEGCNWRFSRSDELARHMRSHTGIKPFVCTHCDKAFARSDHLNKHVKIHSKSAGKRR